MISIRSRTIATVCLSLCFAGFVKGQTYIGKNLKVALFSAAPIEDIRAVSNTAVAVLLVPKQELAIQILIKSLEFDKKLMQEHFNENYMESDTYPLAKFKGVIQQPVDFTKDGEYNVTAKGTLNIHGIDQARTISGEITIKNGIVSIMSSFDVACVSHQIKIPSIVFAKIADVIKISVKGSLNPLKN